MSLQNKHQDSKEALAAAIMSDIGAMEGVGRQKKFLSSVSRIVHSRLIPSPKLKLGGEEAKRSSSNGDIPLPWHSGGVAIPEEYLVKLGKRQFRLPLSVQHQLIHQTYGGDKDKRWRSFGKREDDQEKRGARFPSRYYQ